MCQGDCDDDEDCNGSLKCFQRESSNREETPPGCYGDGVPSKFFTIEKEQCSNTLQSANTLHRAHSVENTYRTRLLLCKKRKLMSRFVVPKSWAVDESICAAVLLYVCNACTSSDLLYAISLALANGKPIQYYRLAV